MANSLLAALPLCLLLAGPATSQVAPPAPPAPAAGQARILNTQIQLGDVFSTQTLDVVDNYGQMTVSTDAVGNTLHSGATGVPADLTSTQTSTGHVRASTTVNAVKAAGTPVTLRTQATANSGGFTANESNVTANVTQTRDAGDVMADTQLNAADANIYQHADVKSTAVGNTQTFEHKIGRLEGRVTQTNSAVTQARTGAVVSYIPSPAVFEAAAVSNHVSSNGTSQATTELTVRQTKSQEGARTQASTFANVGNAWDLKGKAGATANVIDIGNTGGSLIVDAGQTNTNYVRAESVVTAYEFGIAQSEANGVGNAATVGNNDVYLRLDNTQFNDGGVDVQATFEGHNGYDSYVTANAIGNTLTAYSCASCKADMGVTNHQTNQDGVKAQARTVITDAGRNTITSAAAVGNSASIYVTRPQ